jgi:hypothetical protein
MLILVGRIKIKHNYLNNKDLLKEIHKSKNTYCAYSSSDVADYDIIVHDINLIKPEVIEIAKQNRAERLAKLAHDESNSKGEKRKSDEFAIPIAKIKTTDIVIRVMTWEHIPVNDQATKKAQAALAESEDEFVYIEYDEDEPKVSANAIRYVKCNFPPFQHYKVTPRGKPYCVGKSHWVGDLETGYWSRDHGTMTRTLAFMFMKLCERYATRSNWRGYTYNDEMRSQALLQLSQIGLQFDESKSQNPFAYYTAAITNSFTRVLNIEKRNQNLRDDILEMNGFNPSYTRQGMNVGYSHDGDHD